MRVITSIAAIAALALMSSVAAAQSGTGDGTDPQNKGSTGWTGAHPEVGGVTQDKGKPGNPKAETTGQAVQVHDQAEAKDQPLMATGEDLKGPPAQFAPSKTPE